MEPVGRASTEDGHILIGGTGRAGTTLLVQYFTALGFDTGFTLDEALNRVDPLARAGLEHSLERGNLPYVSKSPWYSRNLAAHLDSGELAVRCCIIPMRDLFSAAESRREVSRQAESASGTAKHPGGLTHPGKQGPQRQEARLARQFYELVHTLLERQIPFYFLRFPEFARGEADLFDSLRPLLDQHGVSRQESDEALSRVLRPELINDFAKPRPVSADEG
jgi:hypothetical protein